MALSNYVREQLAFAMGDRAAAKELADGIDTDGAVTLGTRCKRVIQSMCAALSEALGTRKVERYDFPSHVLEQMRAAYALGEPQSVTPQPKEGDRLCSRD